MKFILINIAVIILLSSCKKDRIDSTAFLRCHNTQTLDSTGISTKIIATWKWVKQCCFSSGKTINANKSITVTFSGDTTFIVLENSNVITQGTWKLKSIDSTNWELVMSSPSQYLYGRILFCDNQLLFNNSYLDGCDNLFDRG